MIVSQIYLRWPLVDEVPLEERIKYFANITMDLLISFIEERIKQGHLIKTTSSISSTENP